ncbi:uncharacterized protein NPIL_683621 [Nephila pilipes]|uniref:Uncharacterized protein n=1 Tax=Nephila pilipes TaxID=299642 RepID=A0A8X6TD13_NEPPI|nr:uncharacterized protein NPIL_683621 [Nephila pilipes]
MAQSRSKSMEYEFSTVTPCLLLKCLEFHEVPRPLEVYFRIMKKSQFLETISTTLKHFFATFEPQYNDIIKQIFSDPLILKSKKDLLCKIMPVCLEIAIDSKFLNFYLMHAFMGYVVSFCYEKGECYRIFETLCKCAIAAFHQKFLDVTELEGSNPLQAYSHHLNTLILQLSKDRIAKNRLQIIDILIQSGEEKKSVLHRLARCKVIAFYNNPYSISRFEINLFYGTQAPVLRQLNQGFDNLLRNVPKTFLKLKIESKKSSQSNLFNSQDTRVISRNNKGSKSNLNIHPSSSHEHPSGLPRRCQDEEISFKNSLSRSANGSLIAKQYQFPPRRHPLGQGLSNLYVIRPTYHPPKRSQVTENLYKRSLSVPNRTRTDVAISTEMSLAASAQTQVAEGAETSPEQPLPVISKGSHHDGLSKNSLMRAVKSLNIKSIINRFSPQTSMSSPTSDISPEISSSQGISRSDTSPCDNNPSAPSTSHVTSRHEISPLENTFPKASTCKVSKKRKKKEERDSSNIRGASGFHISDTNAEGNHNLPECSKEEEELIFYGKRDHVCYYCKTECFKYVVYVATVFIVDFIKNESSSKYL